MFRRILKQWFWDCYDHLGRLLTANIILFFTLGSALLFSGVLLAGAPRALALLALVFAMPIWLALWFAPVAHFAHLVTLEKDPPLAAMIVGLRRGFLPCWKLCQIACPALAALLVSIWFYGLSGQFTGALRPIGAGLAGLCIWLTAITILLLLMAAPLLLRTPFGVRAALARSAFLLIRFPGICGGIFLLLIALWALGIWLKFAGPLVFGFVGTMMLMNSLHDVLQAALEPTDDSPAAPEATWQAVRDREKREETQRLNAARYSRTLRDVLRPWES